MIRQNIKKKKCLTKIGLALSECLQLNLDFAIVMYCKKHAGFEITSVILLYLKVILIDQVV